MVNCTCCQFSAVTLLHHKSCFRQWNKLPSCSDILVFCAPRGDWVGTCLEINCNHIKTRVWLQCCVLWVINNLALVLGTCLCSAFLSSPGSLLKKTLFYVWESIFSQAMNHTLHFECVGGFRVAKTRTKITIIAFRCFMRTWAIILGWEITEAR